MLRVDEGKKEGKECPKEHKEAEGGNECLKEHREANKGKAVTAKDEGKNMQYKPIKRKDSTVRPRRKEMLRQTTNIAEWCRPQGRHIIQSAQETKGKGLIEAVAVRSEGSKIKNIVIDGKEW